MVRCWWGGGLDMRGFCRPLDGIGKMTTLLSVIVDWVSLFES